MVRTTSLALVLVLGACSAARGPPAEEPTIEPSEGQATASAQSRFSSRVAAWTEPAAYSFTFESRCGERNLVGQFFVEVEDGEVIAVEGLDGQGNTATSVVQPRDVPTLADLLALVAEARNDGADEVNLVTDPTDGHPVSVEIDWDAAAVDDEECYTVSDFVAGE